MADEPKRTTGWSLRLGSVLGIPIRIHFTFVILLVWYGSYSSRQGNELVLSIVFLLLVFGCVVLHELGHALAARRFGVRTREIVLYPIGGIARLENMPGGKAELCIALAGPAVNLVLAVLLTGVLLLTGAPDGPGLDSPADLVTWLWLANVMLFGFNLIPAFPMDGGRVLRSALSLRMTDERATEIATSVGQAIAVLFGILGILTQNIVWMLIALFVFVGASQEAFFHRQLAAVRGRTAREAMITSFETLAPQDSLARASERLLATHQHDFPVVDAWRRVVGVLSRARLLQALAQHDSSAAVLEVMERSVPTAAPDEDLDRVLRLLRNEPTCPVIVLEDEQIAGMITLENLTEFIEISTRTRAGSGAV